MVIGAGSCYKTREYPNAYNLVHLDFGSGKGTIYLRMYSDRQGGFWTGDMLTYQETPGEYTFDLPYSWITTSPARPIDISIAGIAISTYETKGLDNWWRNRGYRSNPFAWSNAADVVEEIFLELSQLWYIEPSVDPWLLGLGATPTLDGVKSPETSRLILIYAPAGSGKTFYQRLAARQIKESMGLQYALEIRNLK